MTSLIAAALFFFLLHLLVSGTPLRAGLVRAMGENTYMGLFSLASLGGIVWLSMAYGAARGMGTTYWDAGEAGKHTAVAIQFVAFLFIVIGLATPNPTSVRQEAALEKADLVRGMLRITRHPFLWGVMIWAVGHLLANGDMPSIVLFGSLLLLAAFGTVSIDAKRKAAFGLQWEAFAALTSNVPFAAIAAGRQKLVLAEIGWWRPLVAILVYVAVLYAHPIVFGTN
ncbi:MAG TPA: NnrU family protein, partial [Caulobacteraceae bacterium]